MPIKDESPKFAQIYFMKDQNERTDLRMSSNDILKSSILENLEAMLHKHNNYAKSFKFAIKDLDADALKVNK